MRISTKSRYGLRVMLDLAGLQPGDSLTLKEIAARHAISEKYLWQVLHPLASAGLVQASRGSQGGYRLSCPSQSITIKDLVFALDGPCALLSASRIKDNAGRSEYAAEYQVWTQLEKTIVHALTAVNLKDIREHCDERDAKLTYVI